ncbi:2-hydroxy-3-oxopropionate reductase [Tepidanaerobacter syntrophicus]|uniref:2-hydroxy-3-oxopropionate reductase n=1 Tax=Tepidanaerobacter syntrophicus TaxID=224999 RepID=UPI001773F803|nr:2-hydroxy-3-oxopropionate reductase [Tepidanaerobacter syntrophicus]GLI50887.1 2-hydroxy-3-oxopropionate reductase [Tepidanaerobacter syntrophicus]HHV83244.1 2-hydroxy-3-oxopropionate reductase [Tepidanaerobacter syntrophicus]
MRIGFIGLGIMGRPMVYNLIKAGHSLRVYDINRKAVEAVEQYGAIASKSVSELAEKSEVFFTMLPNSSHVEEVVLGENGIISHGKENTLLIDTSSISPVVSKRIADTLRKKGIEMVDAPVSGGEDGAISGTLSIMVGGEDKAFKKAFPVLQAVGRDIIHVGSNGAGTTVKLANQIMVNVNMAAMAEAVTFAEMADIDITKMYEAVRGGAAGSAVLDAKIPKIVKRNYQPGGPISINAKDLQNVIDAGKEINAPLPLTTQVLEMFRSLIAHGHERTDHSGLVIYYEKLANFTRDEMK